MPARFASTLASLALVVLVHYSPAASAMPTTITEFFNTTLAHYVLITSAAEVASIENGAAGPGMAKTGKNFIAHRARRCAGPRSVCCRFYGSISPTELALLHR
ncbi:MAG: hypothetical protein IPM02_23230 [Betaproteobacteria bacterium]|nr:hypothetical protein [Betaproteobacteria bacterium]